MLSPKIVYRSEIRLCRIVPVPLLANSREPIPAGCAVRRSLVRECSKRPHLLQVFIFVPFSIFARLPAGSDNYVGRAIFWHSCIELPGGFAKPSHGDRTSHIIAGSGLLLAASDYPAAYRQ